MSMMNQNNVDAHTNLKNLEDKNDLALTPDTYIPNINSNGDYVDYIPIIKHGIFCPCGARKDKIYSSSTKFGLHCKTKKHQAWLKSMNENKANYYSEMISLKDTVKSQYKIIQKLENQLSQRSLTVDFLSGEITELRQELANIRSGKMTMLQLSKTFENVKCGFCNMEKCWEFKKESENTNQYGNKLGVENCDGGVNSKDLMGFD
jgi:hypothetical protein